jgi:hypothetical protein
MYEPRWSLWSSAAVRICAWDKVYAPVLSNCKAVWDCLGVANEQQTQSQLNECEIFVYFRRQISSKYYILKYST